MPCSDATFWPFDESRDNHISRSNRTLRQDASFNPTREPLFPDVPPPFAQAKADVDNFNGADIHADTMVQVGLRSRFAPRGPYSWQEATLQQINRWLVKRYREHSRRDPAAARAAGL